MATVGQQLLQPESGWRRYDANTGLIGRVGNSYESSEGVNSYGGTLHYYTTSSYPIIKFYGTKFRIIALKTYSASNASSNVAVEIDGSYAGSFSVISTSHQQQMLVFESLNLTKDYHTIKLTALSGVFWFDAIDIDTDGELIRHDYLENAHLDEPLRKYGIAHFHFDEASGSVYDKLGSDYVGTVVGATRVQGWNGEGSAMNFNSSSSYVQSNQTTIPIGEKSIRFKLKVSTKPSVYFSVFANSFGSNQHGDAIGINYDGTIVWENTRGIAGNTRFVLHSTTDVCDGQWHDILIVWDGTTNRNGVKIYIDDMSKANSSITANSTEISLATNNLIMGKLSTYYFVGQLDDLQIYSKALTPADFTQKRLAIRTENNKILTLLEDKIRELPNIKAETLINFGEVIREIDSAVDSEKFSGTFNVIYDKYETIDVEGNSVVSTIEPITAKELLGDVYKLFLYTEKEKLSKVKIQVDHEPQIVYPSGDILLIGVETIDALILNATGNGKIAISFDEGSTWKAYLEGAWNTVKDASDGMSFNEFNQLSSTVINELRGDSETVRFSYYLTSDTNVDNIEMTVSLQGKEEALDTDFFKMKYDEEHAKIVYVIKKSGTYTINYVD